jgi:small subunit ribosomal protein S14
MAKKSLVTKWARIEAGNVKFSTRRYNRCHICGRPRGYMRDFQMCRICFRNLAARGQIPGVTKSSW